MLCVRCVGALLKGNLRCDTLFKSYEVAKSRKGFTCYENTQCDVQYSAQLQFLFAQKKITLQITQLSNAIMGFIKNNAIGFSRSQIHSF
jgi:hypothetical protein